MVNINKIRQLIKEKGLKTSYICSKVGKKHTFLADVANGKSSIADDALVIIANELNTTPEYLKDETDKKEKPLTDDEELAEYLEELKNREEMRMLFSLAKGATKEDVEKAVKIVEAYLKD